MTTSQPVQLFESTRVRSHWDAAQEKWYFSVVDVVQVLTDSTIPKRYWSDLRRKLEKESGQPYEEIVRLKMPAADGRLRETDAAAVPTLLRLIQSIPSPKAEPFKRWLAKVGHERMQEMADPAQSLDRARENWRDKWADKLFAQITTSVGLSPAQVTTVLAKGPLAELTEQLQADLQANGSRTAPVMDARKPRSTEAAPQPLTPRAATELAPSPAPRPSHWPRVLGSVLTGCGTLWALALD